MKFNFDSLINTQVSIAIDTCKPKSPTVKENYQGIIREVYDDFIILKFVSTPHFRDATLKQIIIRKTAILSMWIYDTWEVPHKSIPHHSESLARQVFEWLKVKKGGYFTAQAIFKAFSITTQKDKKNVNMILWRLRARGMVEKVSAGRYKMTKYPFGS